MVRDAESNRIDAASGHYKELRRLECVKSALLVCLYQRQLSYVFLSFLQEPSVQSTHLGMRRQRQNSATLWLLR